MIAAVYARKSTEQTGVTDEHRSVARQIAHARAYAARKGWTVADDHVYSDDGTPDLVRLHHFLRRYRGAIRAVKRGGTVLIDKQSLDAHLNRFSRSR